MANPMPSVHIDPIFAGIPKDMTGFYIWRIEKLTLVAIPRANYGDFHSGDAYIIYCATNQREQGGVNIKIWLLENMWLECKNFMLRTESTYQMRYAKISAPLTKPTKFERAPDIRIHFWLGEDCSIDEKAVAAYKTVELDQAFLDVPTQHREIQGFESIRYLQGGVQTGLKEADDGFRPRLFIIKGAKSPVARELPQISWDVMNDGDAFVLDVGERIFVYIGKNSNRKEQYEATTIAHLFKDQPGESIIRVEDGKEEFQLTETNREMFEKYLPLSKKKLQLHHEFTDDSWVDKNHHQLVRLFKCSDASGQIKIDMVKDSKPTKDNLDSHDCFIVDAGRGNSGLWVWVGKKATEQERITSAKYAKAFIQHESYPEQTPVIRVVDGAEPFEFKALFDGRWL